MIRIREVRKKSGLTMKALGKKVGVAESTVSQYETGKRQPDYETLAKIAGVLQVSVGYLLGDDDKKESTPVTEDGLSEMERGVIQCMRRMTPEQQILFVALLQSATERNREMLSAVRVPTGAEAPRQQLPGLT